MVNLKDYPGAKYLHFAYMTSISISKLLVFFAISHQAFQPYEQRIYFVLQAVLLRRWATHYNLAMPPGNMEEGWWWKGEAEAGIIISRSFLIVQSTD